MSRTFTRVARILTLAALAAYPFLVWRTLAETSARAVAFVLLCVLLPSAFLSRRRRTVRGLATVPLVAIGTLAVAGLLDSAGLVLLVPIAINAALLIAFGSSLRPGSVPLVERFARLQEPHLTGEQVAWCRLWTALWCGFFIVNGSVAGLLAGLAPLSWWAFYNGGVAYVLIGTLVALEWTLRMHRFTRIAHDARAGSDLALLPLPRDSNRRKSVEGRHLAYGLAPDGRQTTWELAWSALDCAPQVARFRTQLPERYGYFQGHFASYPVLAGAVQLSELVLPCARRWASRPRVVLQLQDIKFLANIPPCSELEVLLYTVDATTIRFEVSRGATRCSVGRITFAS